MPELVPVPAGAYMADTPQDPQSKNYVPPTGPQNQLPTVPKVDGISQGTVPVPAGASFDMSSFPSHPSTLANGSTDTNSDGQISTLSTVGSDIANMGKGVIQMAATPLTNALSNMSDAVTHVKNGDYGKAVSSFLAGLTSNPADTIVDSQLQSSKEAAKRMMDAAKQGDALGVAQHAAGIVPGASQVDAAMTNYQKQPSRANLVHIITTAVPLLIPGAIKAGSELGVATKVGDALSAIKTKVGPGAGDAATEAASPIESTVAKSAAKAKLPAGSPAPVTPAGEDIQPTLQQGIRDTVDKIAADNGLKPTQATSIRDVAKDLSDQFYNRSKETFQKVEDATNVNMTDAAEKMNTFSQKIANAIDDPEKAASLEQQRLELENTVEKAFNDAKAQGIDPAQAREDWKKFNAAAELGQHIRNSAEGTMAEPTINPTKLTPKLQKLSESTSPTQPGRLQQLAGDDHANTLVKHAEDARDETQQMKDFVPSTPTGQLAMQDILRPNTKGSLNPLRSGAKTDFVKSFQDFEKLSPEDQAARFGKDATQARDFLKSQARNQLMYKYGKYVGIGLIGQLTGLNKVLLHAIWE